MDLGASTGPMKMSRISAGGNVFGVHGSKVDLEPSEEELVDYSSKFPEVRRNDSHIHNFYNNIRTVYKISNSDHESK